MGEEPEICGELKKHAASLSELKQVMRQRLQSLSDRTGLATGLSPEGMKRILELASKETRNIGEGLFILEDIEKVFEAEMKITLGCK